MTKKKITGASAPPPLSGHCKSSNLWTECINFL